MVLLLSAAHFLQVGSTVVKLRPFNFLYIAKYVCNNQLLLTLNCWGWRSSFTQPVIPTLLRHITARFLQMLIWDATEFINCRSVINRYIIKYAFTFCRIRYPLINPDRCTYNARSNTAPHCYYMFRQICAIRRQFTHTHTHQISDLLKHNRLQS
jgi:hypothetical protein